MGHTSDPALRAASPWCRPDPGATLVIRGGAPLVGTYPISGAKNAVLPLMVSALLTPHMVTLHNVPASLDVAVLASLLLTTAAGASGITESIFEQRLRHVDELRKMGANITVHGRTALVRGVRRLAGARVTATDVRAAAALVLAGSGAEGETTLDGLDHLDRGYDRMAEKLAACGADIRRSAA